MVSGRWVTVCQTIVVNASMSGNLAIFRQRAARTALNRLRLLLLSES